MTLSVKLKELRALKKWTQQDLADNSGVSVESIKRYETNKGNITQATLNKLANALDIDINYFFSDNVSPKFKKVSPNVSQYVDQKCPPMSLNMSSNIDQMSPNVHQYSQKDGYWIMPISHPASAGTSSEIEDVEVVDCDEKMFIPSSFFKTKMQSENLRMLKVEGYSMMPMLYPDSWVICELTNRFQSDGLYIINYQNILMVKLLQMLPNGNLFIKSANPDYESYEIKEDTQLVFNIVGKVLRCII